MQVVVNIRLYEYWHEQVKIRKKRWNNKEIKKFYWKSWGLICIFAKVQQNYKSNRKTWNTPYITHNHKHVPTI
jgi:hypothetical protein